MLKDVTENAVWTKTQSLIQDKYGKRISFKTIDLSDARTPSFLEGDDLIIPLNSKAINLGEVIVNRGSLLSTEQREEIIDLIRFLVEPHIYNRHLKLKEEIEDYKRRSAFESMADDNVVTLFNDVDSPLIKLLSPVVHLKSSLILSRKKVALKIHEMAQQDLFTPFSDICRSINSGQEFLAFDKTTFFIEDLSLLTSRELALLDTACGLKKAGLVFMIGSQMNDQDINQLDISAQLKSDLNAILFDIDRLPLNQQTNTDVLELLFFADHASI